MQLHLDEISRNVAAGAHAVLIFDRAGWHTTGKLDMPDNITPIWLPSRAPELNPVENIWQYLRANWLSNRVFETFDDIIEPICHASNQLTAQPETIASIGRRDWAHVGQSKSPLVLRARLGLYRTIVGEDQCERLRLRSLPRVRPRRLPCERRPALDSIRGQDASDCAACHRGTVEAMLVAGSRHRRRGDMVAGFGHGAWKHVSRYSPIITARPDREACPRSPTPTDGARTSWQRTRA
jgi:hypothetical protein